MSHPDGKDHPSNDYPLNEAYPIIGMVSVEWANIEFLLRVICIRFDNIESSTSNTGSESALGIALSHMELRGLIGTTRALGFRNLNAEQYEALDKLLKHIWDDLRISRNRIIHDDWVALDNGQVFQSKSGALVKMAQSRTKTLALRKGVQHSQGFEALNELLLKVTEARDQLRSIQHELREQPEERTAQPPA